MVSPFSRRARHDRLRGTLSDAAPILWQHGALARLEKGDSTEAILVYNNRNNLTSVNATLLVDLLKVQKNATSHSKAILSNVAGEWTHHANVNGVRVLVHADNTPGTVLHKDIQFYMVRVGIGLYGLHPSKLTIPRIDLQPVMSVLG